MPPAAAPRFQHGQPPGDAARKRGPSSVGGPSPGGDSGGPGKKRCPASGEKLVKMVLLEGRLVWKSGVDLRDYEGAGGRHACVREDAQDAVFENRIILNKSGKEANFQHLIRGGQFGWRKAPTQAFPGDA